MFRSPKGWSMIATNETLEMKRLSKTSDRNQLYQRTGPKTVKAYMLALTTIRSEEIDKATTHTQILGEVDKASLT